MEKGDDVSEWTMHHLCIEPLWATFDDQRNELVHGTEDIEYDQAAMQRAEERIEAVHYKYEKEQRKDKAKHTKTRTKQLNTLAGYLLIDAIGTFAYAHMRK